MDQCDNEHVLFVIIINKLVYGFSCVSFINIIFIVKNNWNSVEEIKKHLFIVWKKTQISSIDMICT